MLGLTETITPVTSEAGSDTIQHQSVGTIECRSSTSGWWLNLPLWKIVNWDDDIAHTWKITNAPNQAWMFTYDLPQQNESDDVGIFPNHRRLGTKTWEGHQGNCGQIVLLHAHEFTCCTSGMACWNMAQINILQVAFIEVYVTCFIYPLVIWHNYGQIHHFSWENSP